MVTDDTNQTNVADVSDVRADKDSLGRFAPGNTLHTKRLHERRSAQFRRAFQSAVSDEEMALMAKQMVKIALAGDVCAARFVAEYTMGKPLAAEVEVDQTSNPGQLVINLVTPETKN